MVKEEEKRLISDILSGNQHSGESADQLIMMYTPMMNKLVNDAVALFPWARIYREDLLQEARIAFYRLVFLYDESRKVKFSTFVYFCLRRSIRGNIRKYYRRSPEMFCAEYSETYEINKVPVRSSIDYQSPEFIYRYNTGKEEYQKIIDGLSELHSRVFDMYLDDYSYREIAVEMDIDCKKVDNIIAGIKRKLRNQIIDLF